MSLFLVIKGFVKHFRVKRSDIKSEQRFDDSMSSLSSSKYMIDDYIFIKNGLKIFGEGC